jgi:UDP-N-acetylmuramyl pentapeptide phosphotransferase/UDP-N-acetylglucosamine-1-phosphate transferase
MSEPGRLRGAGRGGGLLFLAVILFVAYLAVEAVSGVIRLLLMGALVLVVVGFAVTVARRR